MMMKFVRVVAMTWLAAAAGLVGCAKTSDVVRAEGAIILNNDRQTIELTRQHLKAVAGDVEGLKGSLLDVERRAALNAERLDHELQEALQREREIKERIGAIVSAMARSLGAGIAGPLGGGLGGAVGNAINAGIDAAVVTASADARLIVKDSEGRTEMRVTRVSDMVERNSEEIRSANRTIDNLDKRLAQMPTEIQDKVNSLRGTVEVELALIRKTCDPAEKARQLEQLLLSKGLTQAEINKLSEQFGANALMLLLGGGTLLGAGGGTIASRLGKSRSKGEVDKLSDKVSALESAAKKA